MGQWLTVPNQDRSNCHLHKKPIRTWHETWADSLHHHCLLWSGLWYLWFSIALLQQKLAHILLICGYHHKSYPHLSNTSDPFPHRLYINDDTNEESTGTNESLNFNLCEPTNKKESYDVRRNCCTGTCDVEWRQSKSCLSWTFKEARWSEQHHVVMQKPKNQSWGTQKWSPVCADARISTFPLIMVYHL